MSSEPAKRLSRGTLALALGVPARIVTQLATLPVLFAYWPTDRVGAWLALFALPAYLTVVGNSFAGAGGTSALAAAQAGRWDEARAFFRASWGLATLIVTAILALVLLLARQSGDALASTFDLPGDIALEPVLWGLALYVLAVAQLGIVNLPYRVAGRYPLYTMLSNGSNLLDVVVLLACVSQTDSLAVLAFALGAVRLAVAAAMALYARVLVPALFTRPGGPLRGAMADLWRPSLAMMLVPIVFAINVQGYSLLVGAYMGTVTLAAFATTRTLARMIDLLAGVIYGVQFYEAGYGDRSRTDQLRRQLATMTFFTLVLVVAVGGAILVAGPLLQSWLSVGKTRFDYSVALVLLASGGIRGLAQTPLALLFASNRHVGVTWLYLAATVAGFGVALALAAQGAGLPLVLAVLIPVELAQAVPVFAIALRDADWRGRDLLRALVSGQRIADIRRLVAIVLRPF